MRIVTHKQPDADALCAAWLAERYLFPGEANEVVFVARTPLPENRWGADCVVDIGGVHDPDHLVFDHKPPAYTDRNEHCASELLYTHLLLNGKAVSHLAQLIAAVHEGDSNPPRSGSALLRDSRREGFHAQVREARRTVGTDAELYSQVRQWLDQQFNSVRIDSPLLPSQEALPP